MTQPERGGRRWLQLLLGLAISAILIWFGFRKTPFRDVWDQITAMHIVPMLVAVVLATLTFPLRVPRWRLLLRREDGGAVPDRALYHAITIGFAGNNVLPFRLGEVLRMGVVSRLGPVPFSSALSSLAIERVLDGLVTLGLMGLGFLLTDLPAGSALASKATLIGIALVVALVVAAILAWRPRLALGATELLLPAGRLRDRVVDLVTRLLAGLGALRDPRRALPVAAWSLALWLLNAAAFWIAFRAFGISVPFTGALIMQGLLVIGIALPSSPGYVGVFEAGIVIPLGSFFGVPADVALAYAIAYHVMSFVPITLMGAWSLVTTGLSIRAAREAAS